MIMAQHCCMSYTMSTSLKYCPIMLYQIQASLHPFSHPCTNWEPPPLPHPIQQRSSSHMWKGVLATNIAVCVNQWAIIVSIYFPFAAHTSLIHCIELNLQCPKKLLNYHPNNLTLSTPSAPDDILGLWWVLSPMLYISASHLLWFCLNSSWMFILKKN